MDYIIVTFESSNFTMQAESVFKKLQIESQIIPTPREITLSCGMSILTHKDNLNKIEELILENKIKVKEIYLKKNNKQYLERLRP